jgi:hypothetical protein
MLPAFLACAAWVPALWGLGALLAPRALNELRPAVAGLLGFLVLAGLALGVNLVAPVSPAVAAAAWLAGTALFAWRGRSVAADAGGNALAVMTVVLLALCAFVQLPARHYDMGLYYLQAVKWTQEHRQPLGLATLHSRLGFNSSWFALAAILEHPLAVGRSAFLANTIAVWFGAWAVWAGVKRVAAGETSPAALLLVGAALPVAASLEGIGAQGPDYPAGLLVYVSIALGVSAMARAERFATHAAAGFVLAVLAFTVKLSSAPLLPAWALLLVLRRRALDRRALLACGVAVALLALWAARGVMASGCPLFPSRFACFTSLPWLTPSVIAEHVSSWIRSWARAPGNPSPESVLASWDWLGPWARGAIRQRTLCVVAVLFAAGGVYHALRPRSATRDVLAGWAVATLGVAFWFVTAPTVRFGLGFLLAAGLVPVAGASAVRAWAGTRVGRILLVAALAGACLYVAWPLTAWTKFLSGRHAAWARWPEMPRAMVTTHRTTHGLNVQVPWGREQGRDQCWSAPLPCTPYFDAGLRYSGMFTTSTPTPRM